MSEEFSVYALASHADDPEPVNADGTSETIYSKLVLNLLITLLLICVILALFIVDIFYTNKIPDPKNSTR